MSLVKRDLKTRYKSSALGFFWSLCKPLFMMVILFIVFVVIVPLRFEDTYFDMPVEPVAEGNEVLATSKAFGVHLIISVLLWTYFATALGESANSILSNSNLIKKIKIPTEVFPVATVLANLVHFLLALVVLIPLLLLLGYKITWLALGLAPLIVLMTVMIAGLAFFLSSTNVFYRDVSSFTEIFLLGWFYVTPIFYPASVAYMRLRSHSPFFFRVFVANPMATISIAVRRVLFIEGNFRGREVADATFWKYLVVCVVVSLAIYGAGRWVFARLSPYFADEV